MSSLNKAEFESLQRRYLESRERLEVQHHLWTRLNFPFTILASAVGGAIAVSKLLFHLIPGDSPAGHILSEFGGLIIGCCIGIIVAYGALAYIRKREARDHRIRIEALQEQTLRRMLDYVEQESAKKPGVNNL